MKLSIENRSPVLVKTDLLVINIHDGKIDPHSFAHTIDQRLKGRLKSLIQREKFKGSVGQSRLINTEGLIPAINLLLVGLGPKKNFNLEVIRKIAAIMQKTAQSIHARHITTAVHGGHLDVHSKGECTQALVEGLFMANYSFTRYKKKSKELTEIEAVAILCPEKKYLSEVRKGMAIGSAIGRAVCLARDLINTPAKDMAPLDLAKAARGLKGVRTRLFHRAEIAKMKMGAYLGVAQGSRHRPPVFIEMHYRPAGKSKKCVALIGKGVTFDSGGLSLKPAKFMETMKDDMSGAATVIALMSVIAELKPAVEVYGFVAATDNMPDAEAQCPGDVVTAMNGKTIEVLNTDAEGRLTLADALHYAMRKKPHITIDIATLTGACLVALGNRISGIMGNDDALIKKLIDQGEHAGEKMWQLPLPKEYKGELKSPIADLKNVGGAYAGTLTAGLFLQEFVGKTKWAHVDIAGPSWAESPRSYEPIGGTGCMVRTLAYFLMSGA